MEQGAGRGRVCNLSNLLVMVTIRCALLCLKSIQVKKWSWCMVLSGSTLGAEFSHNSCHMGDNEAIWDTKIFFCVIW